MAGRFKLLGAGTALAVGLGDGVVGMVPVVDKYANVHTLYRLGVLAAGGIGLAMGAPEEIAEGAMYSSIALLASRVPAAVNGGGWQQFGMVRPQGRERYPIGAVPRIR